MSWVWLGVLAAAAAALLVVPPTAERRLAGRPGSPLPDWLAPRPGGLAPRHRGLAALAAAGAVLTWTGQLGWGVLVAAPAAAGGAFLALGRVAPGDRAARRRGVVSALPQTCDLLAAAIDAGLPVRLAVEVVAPAVGGVTGAALAGVSARVRLGVPEAEAWSELGAEPGLETLSRELARTVATGAGISRLLRDLAVDARRAAAAEAMVRARRVGVHSVLPLMVAFLPSFVLLGIVPVIGGIVQTVLP